ncbi:MAG: hypothetical protein Q9212_004542 [Teloschistes hypoglaucus]
MATAGAAPVGADPDYAKKIRGVLSTELVLSVIIVGLRCFTRLKLTRSPGLDDVFMVAALLTLSGSTDEKQICAMIGTSLDLSAVNYALNNPILATKLDWLSQAFVITSLVLGKFSVAYLILRASTTRWHRRFLFSVNASLLSTRGNLEDVASLAGELGERKLCLTEMHVIIVAGSLATLRPLVLEISSTYAIMQGRTPNGYRAHTNEQRAHQLGPYPRRRSTHESTFPINGPEPARTLEDPMPAEDVDAIRKTVDVTVAESFAAPAEEKQEEGWDDVDAIEPVTERGEVREDDREDDASGVRTSSEL